MLRFEMLTAMPSTVPPCTTTEERRQNDESRIAEDFFKELLSLFLLKIASQVLVRAVLRTVSGPLRHSTLPSTTLSTILALDTSHW